MKDVWLHRCPYFNCSFTCFTRPQYKQHKKMHIKDKSLKVSKCNFKNCDKIFMKKDDYTNHMIQIHKVLQAKKPALAMVSA